MSIQSIIKQIRQKLHFKRHRLSKHLFAEAVYKKKGLIFRAKEIEVLAIGASHGTRGFDTGMLKNKAYNVCNVDQDLFSSHWIFDQYIDTLKNVKKMVLFFSIPTAGHEVCKTKCIRDVVTNHYVFGVPYAVNYLGEWKRAAQHRFRKFKDKNFDYQHFSGYIPESAPQDIAGEEMKRRCFTHIRENKREVKQLQHMYAMYEGCKKRHIKFYMVITPIRDDFLEELKQYNMSDDELFRDLLPWAKKNKIPVLNALRDSDFIHSDFDDCDHLNDKGAKKLTPKIAKFIGEPLKK